jgi:hypothetical protein
MASVRSESILIQDTTDISEAQLELELEDSFQELVSNGRTDLKASFDSSMIYTAEY